MPASRSPLARSWADFLYVTAAAPLGLAWTIVLATALALGLATAVIMVGIPLLAGTVALWRWGADTERRRAALVLGSPIPRAHRPVSGGLVERWRGRVTDRATWRDLTYMLALGTAGVLSGLVSIGLWGAALAAVVAPVFAPDAPGGSLLARLSGLELAGVVVGGVLIGVLAVPATRGLAVAWAALARRLLAPDERALLAARISALESSRAGAVESADARLRRIERDLHDGAQHRLAYIAMELDRARGRLESDPAAAGALLAEAHEESKRAMRELRDLVRGIHPSVLADRGLDAALSGLAQRSAVPVQVRVELGDRRLPAQAERAAYFVVAEALTNVSRHSAAGTASVRVRRDGGRLLVEVRDDGHGGARRRPGSGLEGLGQRVEALDGSLAIDSPPGGPTTIRAELPCGS